MGFSGLVTFSPLSHNSTSLCTIEPMLNILSFCFLALALALITIESILSNGIPCFSISCLIALTCVLTFQASSIGEANFPNIVDIPTT